MALPTEDLEWVNHLARLHDSDVATLRELDQLYQGTAPLNYLHPEILREVGERIQAVSLGWPMLAVDPLEERLDVLGFRYPEDDDDRNVDPDDLSSVSGDRNLQRIWQDNDLDEESQLGHVDALVMKRAYMAVGSNEDDSDTPLVTVESPLEMFALIDPRTRQPAAALRRWAEGATLLREQQQFATLYRPERTVWYDRGPQGWREIYRDDHNLGEVPVAPLTNRGRLANRYGESELTPALLSLSHAANKVATDMMVGAEFHAIPLRAIFGIGPDDLVDASGKRMSALQVIMGRLLAIPDDASQVKAHEFSASSLTNFHETLNQLARHAAGLIGVDPSTLGLTSDNPASAEALKAREVRQIKRAERKQRAFGGGHERAMRLVRRFQDGDWDPKAKRLETIWRDPATPTRAQAADAALKMVTEGIITKQQAREDLGYTPAQQRRMEAQDRTAAELDPVGQFTRRLGQGTSPGPPVEE